MRQLLRDLRRIDGLIVEENRPLAPLTTMRVGGRADCFLKPTSLNGLEGLLNYLGGRQIPYKVLGNGSNLIVSDEGIDVVICLSRLKRIQASSGAGLYVEAGCTISNLLSWCLRNGYSGIEPLAGIPGSLGGALFMNAGANSISIGDFVEGLCVTTSEGSQWIDISGDFFRYRKSDVPLGGLISAARFRIMDRVRDRDKAGAKNSAMVSASGREVLQNIRNTMWKRRSTQPLGRPSAGCVFRNPSADVPAWSLIASCGLQGMRIRDAQVSEKHANFIVNLGKASSQDILSLIGLIKRRVWDETGVYLKEEVIVWNHEKQRL